MSSRALRRAQQQKEEEERLKRLQQEEEDESSEEESHFQQPQKSAFALLDDANDDEDDSDDEPAQPDTEEGHESEDEAPARPAPTASARKNKKSKRKAKKKAAADTHDDPSTDEIDAMLRQLSTKGRTDGQPLETVDPDVAQACRLLAVDSQNLHAENEMRRLFGRAAMEATDDDGQGRRRNRQQMGGIAAAVGRRQGAQGGRSSGLGLLGLRRNLFVQGKEEWPSGTAGGLGMEVVEKRPDGTVEYRFVHNSAYQDVQADFEVCVRAMDPDRMIRLLQMNPYHISTLLQVSEISKQERDHTTSGDLLERALFSLGRALHSTFAGNLAAGKARMDFRRPENREFWLAVSRYMTNLSMRATWRTVFEWAKLLLSLDPTSDPYQQCLAIDQYALRAKQAQQLLDMAASPLIGAAWKSLPNMQLSLGLAHVQAGNASKGKQALFTAANRSPWVLAALFQAINIDAPPGVWGSTPRTDWEKLMTELYATRAKDLWSSPEAQGLLTEVASAVTGAVSPPAPSERAISLAESRHVLLADIPALIALLPRSATARLTLASDPLPPDDEIRSYIPRGAAPRPQRGTASAHDELRGIYASFGRLMPAMRALLGQEENGGLTEDEVDAALAGSGVSRAEFEAQMQRFGELMGEVGAPTGAHAASVEDVTDSDDE